MNPTVIMVCGVPGSGKTWVCEQLADKYVYVPHDDHIPARGGAGVELALVDAAATAGGKPLITECPFGERLMRQLLEGLGFNVRPYFIVEVPWTVTERYRKREGRNPDKAVLTRAVSIKDRAVEWGAPHGTSEEVLDILKGAA